MEVFRKINGYDNRYSVSNLGNVRKDISARIFKQSRRTNEDNSREVSLCSYGNYEKVNVYKLIADAFKNDIGSKEDYMHNEDNQYVILNENQDKWCAEINCENFKILLRYFDTETDAIFTFVMFGQFL